MTPDLLSGLSSSADVYLQKIDVVRDAGLLIRVDRALYRSASFLDDRILNPQMQGSWAPVARIIEQTHSIEGGRPVHFIFHAGHVGSTLLSRLLDETGAVLSLREPLPLRTLADAYDSLGQIDSLLGETQLESLRRALLKLWGRAYEGVSAVVVKATSSTCRIAPALLAADRAARAVHLNVKSQVYMATLLAGRNAAADLRGHGPVRIRSLQRRLSVPLRPLHALSPGELAALSWLAEAFNAAEMIAAAADRVILLDFDELLVDTERGLARTLQHFGLPTDAAIVGAIARSPVLTRYSKAAEFEYSPALRAQVLNQSLSNNAAEIRRGLAWLDALARTENAVATLLAG